MSTERYVFMFNNIFVHYIKNAIDIFVHNIMSELYVFLCVTLWLNIIKNDTLLWMILTRHTMMIVFLKQTLNNTYLTIENSYEFIESFYSSIFFGANYKLRSKINLSDSIITNWLSLKNWYIHRNLILPELTPFP